MTTIVSDNSPINYLILIESIEILPELFEAVLIPPAVHSELQRARTPPAVYQWAAALPAWAKVQHPARVDHTVGLGDGETEAISLALELRIPAILIDEKKGRAAAEARGLLAVGTLNLLDQADQRGLLDFARAIRRLRQTAFHVDPALIDALLEQVRVRKAV